jgi:hypothetical protein
VVAASASTTSSEGHIISCAAAARRAAAAAPIVSVDHPGNPERGRDASHPQKKTAVLPLLVSLRQQTLSVQRSRLKISGCWLACHATANTFSADLCE